MEFVVMRFLLTFLDNLEAFVTLVGHSTALGLMDSQLSDLYRLFAVETGLFRGG